MRSFGARADTVVCDEPLYAYYLVRTGLEHPGRDDIIASQPNRWQDAVALLKEPLPEGITVQYQKQMTHHLLPEMLPEADAWLGQLSNAYLIRDPVRVIASYAKVRGQPTLADLGFGQQARLFERFGGPVVDADDVLADPAGMLSSLCGALGIDFDPAMLSWPPGRRDTDGVWAPHWYASVESSTGFAAPAPWGGQVSQRLEHLAEDARPYYEALAAHRISAS
jgi:hypothetical protein